MPSKRRLTIAVLGLSAFGSILAVPVADPANLAAKEAFSLGLPQGYAFRGEMVNAYHKNYETWEASVADQQGVIRKFMAEELPRIKVDSQAWAGRYVHDHPEKLMLLHLNGEARQVTTEAEVHQRYFPGHWVYQPGSMLTAALSRDATELSVENIATFKVDAYLDRGDNEDGKHWFPQIL